MRTDGKRYTEANSRFSNAPKHAFSDYIMFHPLHCIFMQGLSSLTCYAAATTRFHPVTRLRWSEATPLFPLYAYMVLVWTEAALLYPYTIIA